VNARDEESDMGAQHEASWIAEVLATECDRDSWRRTGRIHEAKFPRLNDPRTTTCACAATLRAVRGRVDDGANRVVLIADRDNALGAQPPHRRMTRSIAVVELNQQDQEGSSSCMVIRRFGVPGGELRLRHRNVNRQPAHPVLRRHSLRA